MTIKKTLAVFFGGRSSEHEISIISALQLLKSIDPDKFASLPIYIDPTGRWWSGEVLRDRSIYKQFSTYQEKLTSVTLLPEPNTVGSGGPALQATRKGFLGRVTHSHIEFDVAFPVFHGQFGEDGAIQGLFELAGVPYTGSPVGASAVAMNKFVCKQVARGIGVGTLPSVLIRKAQFQKAASSIDEDIAKAKLTYPLFIKPNNLGSSVGVGSAKSPAELLERLAHVFGVDSEAIVEPMLSQMLELNISVGPNNRVSVLEMPVASEKILTYEDKYLRGGKGKKGGGSSSQGMAGLTRVIDPQDISTDVKESIKAYALTLFNALGCQGIGRFDFMIDTQSNQIYFNELNPLPGSLSFYLWEKSTPKLLYPQIINLMVENALETYAIKATLRRDMGFKAL